MFVAGAIYYKSMVCLDPLANDQQKFVVTVPNKLDILISFLHIVLDAKRYIESELK